MLDANTMRAVGMMVARLARERAIEAGVKANEVIDLSPLLKEWKPGKHNAGDVVVYNDYPYRVNDPGHDSTGNDSWNPEDTPALFSPYHATDAAHALPWKAPTSAADAYQAGEWMLWTDGKSYRCKQDATVWGPDILSTSWEMQT